MNKRIRCGAQNVVRHDTLIYTAPPFDRPHTVSLRNRPKGNYTATLMKSASHLPVNFAAKRSNDGDDKFHTEFLSFVNEQTARNHRPTSASTVARRNMPTLPGNREPTTTTQSPATSFITRRRKTPNSHRLWAAVPISLHLPRRCRRCTRQ